MGETSSERLSTAYEVLTGETVEALLRRMEITGSVDWHYDHAEVRIKIIKPPWPA